MSSCSPIDLELKHVCPSFGQKVSQLWAEGFYVFRTSVMAEPNKKFAGRSWQSFYLRSL